RNGSSKSPENSADGSHLVAERSICMITHADQVNKGPPLGSWRARVLPRTLATVADSWLHGVLARTQEVGAETQACVYRRCRTSPRALAASRPARGRSVNRASRAEVPRRAPGTKLQRDCA